MKPAKRQQTAYEKLSTSDLLSGTIEDVRYEKDHLFKGFTKKNGEVIADRRADACQFKFRVDGYTAPHYSRWMTFNYGEKSTLFQKYLMQLVDNAKPDMDFDLDQLKGMKVKMLWTEKNDFQQLETIRPASKKLVPLNVHRDEDVPVDASDEDEPPF